MKQKVALIFGLLAVIAHVTLGDEDKKVPIKYKPFEPSTPVLDRSDDRGQQNLRPGFVVNEKEENRPFRYSEKLRPQRSPDLRPQSTRPFTPPQPRPSVPRRPQQPQPGNQEPSGFQGNFGPSVGQNSNPPKPLLRAPQPAPARPAVADFKPFDEPESGEKENTPAAQPPPRPARNPSQYRPRPVEESYQEGFPAGFADGLPKFNFQEKIPDAPAGESRGFLDGFSSFPDFRTIGGFEPLGAANEHAVTGARPSNLRKRNPEEYSKDGPEAFSLEQPEARGERNYNTF